MSTLNSLPRDPNRVPVVGAVDDTTGLITPLKVNNSTGNLRTDSSDYRLDVARDKIADVSSFALIGINPDVGITTEDITDQGGTFVYPTAAETWEVISSDANDDDGDTGARTVLITGLDTDYNEITETVTLNGTSAVATTETTWFRPKSVLVVTAGSTLSNEGTITVRVSGGGATRLQIKPANGTSFFGLYTVPAGKTAYFIQASLFVPKNEDIIITTLARLSTANAAFLKSGPASIYQMGFTFDIKAYGIFPEKTDVKFTAISTNDGVSVTSINEFYIIDGVEGTGLIENMAV